MKKFGVMLLMVAVGVAIGLAVSGNSRPVQAKSAPGTGFVLRCREGWEPEDIPPGAYDVVKKLAAGYQHTTGEREVDLRRRRKRVRRESGIVFICCSAANCRKWRRPKQLCFRRLAPA